MTPFLDRSLAMVFSPLLLLLLLISQTLASSCLDPTLTHSSHTSSSSSAVAASAVFIVSFDVSCSNKEAVDLDTNLYAVLTSGGKAVSAVRPAAKSAAGGYQASFVGEHGELPRGSYKVEIYDDQGFSALKKVQRAAEGGEAGGEAAAVSPLALIAVEHGGVGGGLGEFVRGETAALVLFGFAFYLAHSAKSHNQSE